MEITFIDIVETYNTNLNFQEFLDRLNKLDILMAVIKKLQEDKPEFTDICEDIYGKADKAYNNYEDFTGVIELTEKEKEALSCLLDYNISRKIIELINYYRGENEL